MLGTMVDVSPMPVLSLLLLLLPAASCLLPAASALLLVVRLDAEQMSGPSQVQAPSKVPGSKSITTIITRTHTHAQLAGSLDKPASPDRAAFAPVSDSGLVK